MSEPSEMVERVARDRRDEKFSEAEMSAAMTAFVAVDHAAVEAYRQRFWDDVARLAPIALRERVALSTQEQGK